MEKNHFEEQIGPFSITVKNVKKLYNVQHQNSSSIFEKISTIGKKTKSEKIVALDGISFDIKHGEMIGIIGRNGSGKSTLLKILAGIIDPSQGYATTRGKVAPFLALGSGFNPELTAKENIILYGILLGASKNEMVRKFDEILGFAELEKYQDVKLKAFSSGMFMRLAFSVAVNMNPDIILIDEVLAVGDASFQQKSFKKLMEFKDIGKTIVLVTHALELVESYCNRAIFLDKGKAMAIGPPKMVIEEYRNALTKG